MPSPQMEDGFTPIPNEILEALCKVNLSPYESRVLWFLLRKTYGWKKKSDRIALSQFSKGLGLDRRLVHRALKKLSTEKKMIVISRDDKNRPTYGFQKDYSKWRMSSRKMTVIGTDDGVSSTEMMGVSSVEMNTKETITKETIQKKRGGSNGASHRASREGFEVFWQAYPRKRNKGQAERVWQRINPSPVLLKTMLDAIQQAKRSKEWLKDKGCYIPYPATWLNAKGWEDEIETEEVENPYAHWPVIVDCQTCGDAHEQDEQCQQKMP